MNGKQLREPAEQPGSEFSTLVLLEFVSRCIHQLLISRCRSISNATWRKMLRYDTAKNGTFRWNSSQIYMKCTFLSNAAADVAASCQQALV